MFFWVNLLALDFVFVLFYGSLVALFVLLLHVNVEDTRQGHLEGHRRISTLRDL